MFYSNELKFMEGQWGKADLNPSVKKEAGHLTANIWKSTTEVGCAVLDCSNRVDELPGTERDNPNEDKIPPIFTVCNYGPPGMFCMLLRYLCY